jgi:formylglycine-generating enzyme required for sulfatase activity
MSVIQELADSIPAKHILFVIDTCYGGIAGKRYRSVPRMTTEYLRQITREPGRQLISAGGANQKVLETPDFQHSVFTYYLLEGLSKGLADLNKDGLIPASELYTYLDSRVVEAARTKGHMQRPEFWNLGRASDSNGEFVFTIFQGRVVPSFKVTGLAPMVDVPEGYFTMGSVDRQNESPPRQIYLDRFWIDQYEVTVSRYSLFLDAYHRQPILAWNDVNEKTDADKPVIGVTWEDANSYCQWLGKRLPTEAEWEKAARGTDGRQYPWGNDPPTMRHANFGRCCDWNGYSTLKGVGQFPDNRSPYGVYDLAGNVWEWVSDWYDDHYYMRADSKNPQGPSSGTKKVVRGGSWGDQPLNISSTVRNRIEPKSRHTDVGFRCAQDTVR